MTTTWMHTYTGRRFDLAAPKPEDVSKSDIAHALAYSSRFNGHTPQFYSIAEHSIHVSGVAGRLAREKGYCGLAERLVRLYGLLHDAHEAYTGDIIRPMQHALNSISGDTIPKNAVMAMQGNADDKIREALGIPATFGGAWSLVHEADDILLATEARRLFGIEDPVTEWGLPFPPDLTVIPNCGSMTMETAENVFLSTLEGLLE